MVANYGIVQSFLGGKYISIQLIMGGSVTSLLAVKSAAHCEILGSYLQQHHHHHVFIALF